LFIEKYLDFCNPSNVLDVIEAFERLAVIWQIEGTPGRLPPDQWDVLRRLVLKRDGYKCRICAADNATLDVHHIIPVVNHGPNWLTNLITLRRACHEKIHPHMKDQK
jgi:5-methylcytosine-specific restriction endonuclease McrA